MYHALQTRVKINGTCTDIYFTGCVSGSTCYGGRCLKEIGKICNQNYECSTANCVKNTGDAFGSKWKKCLKISGDYCKQDYECASGKCSETGPPSYRALHCV